MKFRIVEDLEQDLKQEAINNQIILNNIDVQFDEINFDKQNDVNGISYNKEIDQINASFYIDTKLNYKAYITKNDFTTSLNGKVDTIEQAVDTFINQYNSLL